jgi:hypothetical protein
VAAVAALALVVPALLPSSGDDGAQPAGQVAASGAPASVPHARPERYERRWSRVLADLDRQRADAWRTGDAAALRKVYLPRSPELARDEQMLGAYLQRGLTVTGVRLSYLVLRAERLGGDGERLLVVDRLQPAAARDARGRRVALPVDNPTRHAIVLRHWHGSWRIAAVTLA